ncbi:hypothetical protein Clacol_000806 [Clathrus columnatus]|uniref:Uncharacterized protein n=1 Tax=Clathrus columnatus TaxID=1419009 RepID=A0AAV5A1U9_9AGAM|nr:hypothetical protein Clacol_000806 [Clathrus columnatus]
MAENIKIALHKKEKPLPPIFTNITVQYYEKTLLCYLEVPVGATVATVKGTAIEKMKNLLKEGYNITIGEFDVIVEPKPRAENQPLTELGQEIIIKLKPLDESITPPYNKHKCLEKGIFVVPVDVVLTLPVDNRPTDLGIMKNEELDKILSEEKKKFNAELKQYRLKVEEQLLEHKIQVDERFQEQLLAHQTQVDKRFEEQLLKHKMQVDQRFEEQSKELLRFASLFHSSASDMATFLVNDHSPIRDRGNTAAHTAQEEDISRAIQTLSGDEQDMFTDFYKLVFDQELL